MEDMCNNDKSCITELDKKIGDKDLSVYKN